MHKTNGTPADGSTVRAVLAALACSDADLGDGMWGNIAAAYTDLEALTTKAASADRLSDCLAEQDRMLAKALAAYAKLEHERDALLAKALYRASKIDELEAALVAAKAAQVSK